MTDDQLNRALVVAVLGWRLGVNRYLKPKRSWTPLASVVPAVNIKDAFTLLEAAKLRCTLRLSREGLFEVEIEIDGREVRVSGNNKARTICDALALALELTPRGKES